MTRRAGLDVEAVVEAAGRLADAEGLESLTLAGLAEQLGIRTPSLYNHVAGLPGLHRELALRGTRELTARLARAAIGKSRADAVMAMADAFRAFIKEHPGLYAATVRSAGTMQPVDAELAAASQEAVEVVLAALASYGFSGAEALHAVRALRSVVHGFATLELAGGFGIPLDTDESFQRLVGMLIEGLEQRAER